MIANWPRQALIGAVRGYQIVLSPWLGSSCRFEPSCSHYALDALGRHGAIAGSVLTAGRIARCAPWCDGGHDPVPASLPRIFSRLVGDRRAAPQSITSDSQAPAAPTLP